MDGYRSLLVPLDGSELAELALPVATRLALRDGAAVHLVRAHHALMPEETPGGAEWEAWTREEDRRYLDTVAAGLSGAGIGDVTVAVVGSPVPDAICEHGTRVGANLVVMATHGRTGFSRLWFGSVADAVVRHSSLPVLLVRAAALPAAVAPYRRVLVPLDGSAAGEAIVPHAIAVAAADGAELIFARVVSPVQVPVYAYAGSEPGVDADAIDRQVNAAEAYMHDIVRDVRRDHPSIDAEAVVHVNAQPAAAIIRLASAQKADMVAMSTHGRGGSRLVVGSVADKVLRGTSGSLLVCRS